MHYNGIEDALRGVPPKRYRDVEVVILPSDSYGGMTSVRDDVAISLHVPGGAGERSRVIRIHELLHSRLTFSQVHMEVEAQIKPEVCHHALEAADDCYIHRAGVLDKYSTPDFRRAARKVAAEDIRSVNKDGMKRADAVLVYARSVSLLLGTRARVRKPSGPIGPLSVEDAVEIQAAVRQLVMAPAHSAEEAYRVCAMRLDALIPRSESLYSPGGAGGEERPPDGSSKPIMAVVERPRPRSATGRTLARTHCRTTCGKLTSRISDVVRGVVAHDPRMLFLRRQPGPGGTILIDASGSMRLCDSQIMQLAETYPSGTVAAYGGYGWGLIGHAALPAQYGELHILARAGRVVLADRHRFNGKEENAVDLYALRWLLRQPAPRIIVTDGQFFAGPPGQADAARTLLRVSVRRGAVQHYRTIGEVLDAAR